VAIRDDVIEWDISGLSPRFRLAQMVLLRHDEDALALLDELIAEGSIDDHDLDTLPLFARYRAEGIKPFSRG
jgi:hypothetical protein